MSDQPRLSDDYHINTDYAQPDHRQPQQHLLPKVRSTHGSSSSSSTARKMPTAVPATPRMLRNSSGNYLPHHNTPSSQQTMMSPIDNNKQDSTTRQIPAFRPSQTPHMQSPLNSKSNQVSRSPPKLPQLDTATPQTQTPSRLLPPASVDTSKQGTSQQISPSRTASHAKKPSHSQPQQFHRKSIGDWDFVKTVGAGSMGKVKLAKHRGTGEICAIKIVPRAAKLYARAHANDAPPATSQEALARQKEYEKELARDKRTIREASLGRILYHPYICRLFEVKVMSNHYYMLFEYVSGGQMLDYIVSHGSLKERHARKFARGIGSALDYLHKNNVVHRDLKIENIMISKSGDIKIIDFGLSNMYSYDALLKTYCGSLYFAAPELLSAHPYIGPEVDVWSFGVVLYVLVCGKVPFDDQSVSVLHEKIKKGKVEYPEFLSSEVVSLLSRMLVVNPNNRATLPEVLSHPWMTRGYEGRPDSYVPHRYPLVLPLDETVIREIVRLDFGKSEEQVSDDLIQIISSPAYQTATHRLKNSQDSAEQLTVDPRLRFHPLISIYYLVDEMLKRKKTRESIVDIPVATDNTQTTEPEKAETQKDDTSPPPLPQNLMTPTPPPQLTFPEAAHTSPVHISSPMPIPDKEHPQIMISDTTSGHDEIVQQQQSKTRTSEESKGGLGIFRKFSQRRTQSTTRPPHGHSIGGGEDSALQQANAAKAQADVIRRVGSMKLTRPKYEEDSEKMAVKSTKSHNRTVSAYAGNASMHTGEKIPPLPTHLDPNVNQRKFHPTARAKSVGHRRDHNTYNGDAGSSNSGAAPAAPTDLNDDAFFDDITLDNFSANSANDKMTLVNTPASQRPDMSEQQILQEAAEAPSGTMPSIEYPRSMFLKGFFSVQTTSTKPLPVIRSNVISVLSKFGVRFTEVRGGFVCVHTPSIKETSDIQVEAKEEEEAEANGTKSETSSNSAEHSTPAKMHAENTSLNESWNDQTSTPSSASKAHRRKFSIGGSILGYRRKPSLTAAPAIPPTPIATSNFNALNSPTQQMHHPGDFDSSASLDSLNGGGHGGSDMLVSSRLEQNRTKANTEEHGEPASRTPLKFEIHIVKVPLVGLYGVHFKKVAGNTWVYKKLAERILNELSL